MERINGFNRKLHPYQIITYIFFIGIAASFYLIVFSLSSNLAKIIGGSLEGIFIIFVAVSGYRSTAIDPSDPYLQLSRKARFERKAYTPEEREFYCTSDHTYVKTSSRHCKRCNRCTEEFDHHCKWINNDIGKANYKSFFAMITSVMLLLVVYLVCSILVTIEYATDSYLLENDIFIYGGSRDQIIIPMVIMWVFMGLSTPFLLLDTNLVLLHIFLTYKGLTTFQYITAVEERKEYKKELEYAMKILGGKKSTCLDFVLCLKKRKVSHNKLAKPQETPNCEQELPQLTPNLPNQVDDVSKQTADRPASKATLPENAEDEFGSASKKAETKDNDVFTPETIKRDALQTSSKIVNMFSSSEQELGSSVQPIVMKIERDQEKRRSQTEKVQSLDDNIKTTAPALQENEGYKTPKKQIQEHICLEIDQDNEGDLEDKNNKHDNLFASNPRAASYSVEKEKPTVVTGTHRSIHTPLISDLRGNFRIQQELDSYRLDDSHRHSNRKRSANEGNDRGAVV